MGRKGRTIGPFISWKFDLKAAWKPVFITTSGSFSLASQSERVVASSAAIRYAIFWWSARENPEWRIRYEIGG
jgi:hypothetical protein